MDVGATQYMGSQSQQPILLQQPALEVIGKQELRRERGGREILYLIRFIGYDSLSHSQMLPRCEILRTSTTVNRPALESGSMLSNQ